VIGKASEGIWDGPLNCKGYSASFEKEESHGEDSFQEVSNDNQPTPPPILKLLVSYSPFPKAQLFKSKLLWKHSFPLPVTTQPG